MKEVRISITVDLATAAILILLKCKARPNSAVEAVRLIRRVVLLKQEQGR